MDYFIKHTFIYKLIAYIVWLIIGASLALSEQVVANQPQAKYSLTIEPEQCVAMHQGQLCYVNAKVSWRAEQIGSYCLFSSQQTKALQCWSNVQLGKYQQDMSANKNLVFSLRKKGSSNKLVTKELEMAWVYKKNTRKNISWRMF